MCSKTLFKQLLKISNNYSKPASPYSYSRFKSSSGHSNLKQVTLFPNKFNVSTRNVLCRNNINYFRQHITYEASSTSGYDGNRFYCSKKQPDLPRLMDLPQVVWPSIFKSIRNWILSNFIIMRYFDPEFSLDDFVIGSKKAVEVVSGLISKGEVDSLTGLVAPEVISQVKEAMTSFTLKQRQEFAITADDVYFAFPYEVGVMFPEEGKGGENQSRFVEITMCYHALKGLKELRSSGGIQSDNVGAMPEYQDKIFICNYRFIREFTKGVNDEWTINAINHFKPAAFLQL